MAIVQNWLPPSEENYNFAMFWWSLFPVVCPLSLTILLGPFPLDTILLTSPSFPSPSVRLDTMGDVL